MRPVAYQGAVAPESLQVLVRQGDSPIDLTTATACSFLVQLPDGTTATWSSATLSEATPLQVLATRAFLSGDLPLVGKYVVVALLTVPGGTVRGRPQILTVLSQFQVDSPAAGP